MGRYAKRGGAVFRYKIEEDGKEFIIQKQHVSRICLDNLNDQIHEVELVYLTNLLIFIELGCQECKFGSTEVEDTVNFIEHPGSDSPQSKTLVKEILDK